MVRWQATDYLSFSHRGAQPHQPDRGSLGLRGRAAGHAVLEHGSADLRRLPVDAPVTARRVTTTRREALGALAGRRRFADLPATAQGAAACASIRARLAACARLVRAALGHGFEGQRKPDLGDGTFLNPLVSGDHPDPSILRDGADYYLTFSSFDAYPGLPVWHSTGPRRTGNPSGSTLNEARRFGLGAGARASRRAGSTTTSTRARREYRSLYVITRGTHRRAVERSGRPEAACPHRSRACGRRRRQAIPVPQRWRSRALTDDGLATDGAGRACLRSVALSGRVGSSRPSRPKGRRSCGMASGST